MIHNIFTYNNSFNPHNILVSINWYKEVNRHFPDDSVVKNLSADIGDTGLIPDPGRSHIPWNN